MPYKADSRTLTNEAIHDLVSAAKRSPDAIFVENTVSTLSLKAGDVDVRAKAIEEIAQAHWNTTNVVVASLTSLLLLDVPTTRRLSHAVLSEPFHPDRDIIIARAATALIELAPPEASDIPLISKALTSRLDLISADTKRSLNGLLPSRALGLLTLAREGAKDGNSSRLIHVLEERLSNSGLTLPARPTEIVQQSSIEPSAPKREKRPSIVASISQPTSTNKPEARSAKAPERRTPPKEKSPAAAETPSAESRSRETARPKTPLIQLENLRSPDAAKLSLTELRDVANHSKDHTRILSSVTEVLIRHGRTEALKCMNGFIWATSDPENPLKVEFARLSDILFPR